MLRRTSCIFFLLCSWYWLHAKFLRAAYTIVWSGLYLLLGSCLSGQNSELLLLVCVLQVDDVPLESTNGLPCRWHGWWSPTVPLRTTRSCCQRLLWAVAAGHHSDMLLQATYPTCYCQQWSCHRKVRCHWESLSRSRKGWVIMCVFAMPRSRKVIQILIFLYMCRQ